jgi:large subunit ribosomal protein L1
MLQLELLLGVQEAWVLKWRDSKMSISKRMKSITESVDRDKLYPIIDGLALLKDTAKAKFDESVDASVNLGIDSKKTDQSVRGALVLPNGTGKITRIAVFAQGDAAEAAKKAGADIVGYEDLAKKIKAGEMNFDVVIATPDAMKILGPLAQILGPRGLMPNPKVGTVTPDTEKAVKNAKAGQVQYRTDKAGIIHCTIGRASFSIDHLQANLVALMDAINKAKPTGTKGIFIKKISISSTMGVGIKIDQTSLAN